MKEFVFLSTFILLCVSISRSQHQDLTLTVHGSTEIPHVSIVSVSAESLEIGNDDQHSFLTIESVTHVKGKITRPQPALGIALGTLIGATAGVLVGTIIHQARGNSNNNLSTHTREIMVLSGGIIGGLIGGLTASSTSKFDYDLTIRSSAEKQKIFEDILGGRVSPAYSDSSGLGKMMSVKSDSLHAQTSMDIGKSTANPWTRFGLRSGLVLPLGNFGDPAGGGALTGFTIGVSMNVTQDGYSGWYTSIEYTRNSFDEESIREYLPGVQYEVGSWSNTWMMTGVRVGAEFYPGFELAGVGQMGVLISSSPSLTISRNLGNEYHASYTQNGFAFCVGVESFVESHYGLSVRFLNSEVKQSISILEISAAYRF